MATAELIRVYPEVVAECGGDPDSFLSSAGIEPALLHQPGQKLPLRLMGELLEHTAKVLDCPDLGLRMAARHGGWAVLKPLDRLICNAPTVGESLRCSFDHIDAFNSGMRVSLDRDADRSLYFVSFEFRDGLWVFPQLTEELLLLCHSCVGMLSEGFARSRSVWFSHLNRSHPAVYTKHFGAIVKFGQESDGIFFHEADIKAKVVDSDADIFAAESRLIAEHFPARSQSIDTRVRQLIYRALAESNCSRQQVAASLGLHERSLNRYLSKAGTSFEAIRDEVRRNLAFRYLIRGDLPLNEISARLGYSELAVLSRSCHRWFGAPPNELRRNLLSSYVGGQ